MAVWKYEFRIGSVDTTTAALHPTGSYPHIEMRRLLIAASILLVAASPGEVVPELEANGFYIEPGSSASEDVVSDAVFEARSDGGRLYLVVLAEEPPGGATTFADSVLDQLVSGYVVTVAPETVGFAGDGSFWGTDEMNAALDASLDGASDDEVVQLFVSTLTGGVPISPDPGDGPVEPTDGGISGWVWVLLLIGGGGLLFFLASNSARRRSERAATELAKVKGMARGKLAEIANDIIEMEDEVALSANPEVTRHYQQASAIYTEVLARVEGESDPREMVDVVKKLDDAIWELDAAEALLDDKPIPEKPKPPEEKQPVSKPRPGPGEASEETSVGRRPERQSSYAGNDLMNALWALIAMSGRRDGWGHLPGGFGGPMSGGRTGGGGRMRGGGMRGTGGRMRGGGRRS